MKRRTLLLTILVGASFFPGYLLAQWGDFTSIDENVKATDGVITKMRIDWTGPFRYVKVRLNGEFEVSETFDGVRRLTPGTALIIEEKREKQYRKLEIRDFEKEDQPVYRYSYQFEEKPYDAAAQAWFAEIMIEIIREAGVLSRQRAAKIHAADARHGLLTEIDKINRERSKRFYYERLLEQRDIETETLDAILKRIPQEFEADANFRIVLSEMLSRHELKGELLREWIQVTPEVNNDVTRANLLTDVVNKISPDDLETMAVYRKAAESIRSETERTRALAGLK